MTIVTSPQLRRSPSGNLFQFAFDTDDVENRSRIPGDSLTDALDTLYEKRIEYLDLEDDPITLWNFDDTLTAVRGPTLSVAVGDVGFTDVAPGIRGLDMGDGVRIQASSTASLILLGDMSCEVLIQLNTSPTNQWICGVGGQDTGASANNVAWSMIMPQTNIPRNLQTLWESGAGVDRGFATSTASGSPTLPPVHNVMSLGFSRSGVNGQFYYNGRTFGPLTSGVALPDGGASGRFTIGARFGSVSPDQFLLLSIAVYDRARDAAEWLASYNRSLGNAYGFIE